MDLAIKSEADAWRVLAEAVASRDPNFGGTGALHFSGWPRLNIYLDVENALLTPTLMRAVVDFQDNVWRSYALVKKHEANIALLTDEEKAALELEVAVSGGSLTLASKAWEKLKPFVEEATKKMDGKHVTICVLGIAVCFYGADVWKADFQHRADIRKAELTHTERLEELKARQFISAQETERMKILETAYKQAVVLREIAEQADAARVAVLKNVPASATVRLQGTTITGALANELARNPRETGHEARVDGTYSVQRVDTRNAEGFQVMVRDLVYGSVFSALLRDDSSVDLRKVIERATFEKKKIKATIDMRRKKGKVIAAWIIKAELAPEGWKPPRVSSTKKP